MEPQEPDGLLTVTYTGEPDVVHQLTEEGQQISFGRDDECDVVIWSAINSNRLSARAGVVWRQDGELWLRNLSTAHDLAVEIPGQPPDAPLRPRPSRSHPGFARSIGAEIAVVRGPDGCELILRQMGPLDLGDDGEDGLSGSTVRVPRLPAELRPVAAALCEPLLGGSQLPATYTQVMNRTGTTSRKRVRNLVDQLVAVYMDELPALAEQVRVRLEREAALDAHIRPILRQGVVRFRSVESDESQALANEEAERRSALALPAYYEVAHLLVRRGVVTARHVAALDE